MSKDWAARIIGVGLAFVLFVILVATGVIG